LPKNGLQQAKMRHLMLERKNDLPQKPIPGRRGIDGRQVPFSSLDTILITDQFAFA
jgi:hypothetical protein